MKKLTGKSIAVITLLGLSFQMLVFSTSVSSAMDAASFLASMAGNYRGRGTAVPFKGANAVRVSCKLSNSYKGAAKSLSLSGVCASTQGKVKVRGSLSNRGKSVTGSFIAPFAGATLTTSSGRMSGGKLLIHSTFKDKTGKLNKVRQVLTRAGKGFRSDVYVYEKAVKKFRSVGSMKFTRK